MNFTKSALLMAGLWVSATVFATPDPAAFQAMKNAHIANIQERLQIVQTSLSCVQAAQDHAAMKVCHDAAEQANKALTEKIKSQMAEKKAEREAKKQTSAPAPVTPAAK